ncbi:hypothetical protein VTO42DRAFT_3024 [Malbranchea cinnamomea]
MSFRKRNIGLSPGIARGPAANATGTQQVPSRPRQPVPGLRPSPLDGRQTTSTGTPTLDNLLAGHAGLPLGTSILIEENGTTDFAGALLRYYAAEGVVQEQRVYVVGFNEQWGATLPGLIGAAEAAAEKPNYGKEEKMKIAWRYERLGQFGIAGSRVPAQTGVNIPTSSQTATPAVFCHAFDLTKRLVHPSTTSITYIPLSESRPGGSPYEKIIQQISTSIANSPSNTVHRLIIPSLLSPALYPPQASQPEYLLQFMHSIRALLAKDANRMTAMITFPLSLYSRATGLVRWVELLCDGVFELAPFPHMSEATSGAATAQEEPPQGLLRIHKLPVFHERGGGTDSNMIEDWAFTLSRKKFSIKPFHLPPVEGDKEAQLSGQTIEKSKADLDF